MVGAKVLLQFYSNSQFCCLNRLHFLPAFFLLLCGLIDRNFPTFSICLNYLVQDHPASLFPLSFNYYFLLSILVLSVLFMWPNHCNCFSSISVNKVQIPTFLNITFLILSLLVLLLIPLEKCHIYCLNLQQIYDLYKVYFFIDLVHFCIITFPL